MPWPSETAPLDVRLNVEATIFVLFCCDRSTESVRFTVCPLAAMLPKLSIALVALPNVMVPLVSVSARLVAINAPALCEIAPVEIRLTLLLLTFAPRLRLLLLPAVANVIVPVPAVIACVVLNVPLLLVIVTLPLVVAMPLTLPTVPIVRAPELLIKFNALELVLRLAASVPMLLLFVRVTLPLEVKLAPAAVMMDAPFCVISPVTFAIKLRPMVAVSSNNALPLVMLTSLVAPLFIKVTAPVNAFACVNVIALLPALKREVPATVNAPVCVMAPPAMADRLPLLCKVNAENAMPAPSNCSVKLRRLVKLARFVGKVAAALILRNATSRMLPNVPLKVTAPMMLFACVFNATSVFAAVDAMVNTPVLVIAPVSVNAPPDVIASVPLPTFTLPSVNAPLFVNATLFARLLLNDTAPLKALFVPFVAKSIACAPALKLAVPPTVNAPLCAMLPLVLVMVRLRPMLEAASVNAALFVNDTSFAPLLESVTAPLSALLIFVNVMLCALTLKLDVPATVNAVLACCVKSPFAVAVKLRPAFTFASSRAMLLLMLMSLLPLLESVTAPVKALFVPLVAKSIACAPALKFEVPDTVIAPVCEIAPVFVITKLPTGCAMLAMLKS